MITSPTKRGKSLRAATYWLLVVMLVGVLAGCGQGGSPTATVPAPTATTAAAEPTATTAEEATPTTAAPPSATTAQATATVAIPAGDFMNPVIKSDFPDPGVIDVNGTYYAYATNSAGTNIQEATSTDLVDWKMLPDALPVLPSWANPAFGNVWAPEVMQIGDRFVMYYTARVKDKSTQCLGVATSDKPEGPFKDTNDKPFICQVEGGGSIDPSPFRDGDKLYLYWKNDGNCCGGITYIWVQELSPDGMSLVGEPQKLVQNDERWEGPVIEAPTMWKQDDKYYLFFSGNVYNRINYAVGYANCDSATGPCKDSTDNPILKTDIAKPPVLGPGHQTIVKYKDELWFVYHAWAVPVGGKLESRQVYIDRLTFDNGKPVVHGPTQEPQPRP